MNREDCVISVYGCQSYIGRQCYTISRQSSWVKVLVKRTLWLKERKCPGTKVGFGRWKANVEHAGNAIHASVS